MVEWQEYKSQHAPVGREGLGEAKVHSLKDITPAHENFTTAHHNNNKR